MSSYSNALSDKLVVCSFSDCEIYTVYSKDESRKWTDTRQDNVFPEELSSSIFSVSHHIQVGANFCLSPLDDSMNHKDIFKLNFGSAETLKTKSTDRFEIVYDELPAVNSKNLVGVQESIDIELLYQRLNIYAAEEGVLVVYDNSHITILVKNRGDLVLANRYQIDNLDECFYYVMLAIEQLNLTQETLKIDFVGAVNFFKKFSLIMEGYVQRINNRSDLSISISGLTNKEILAQYYSKCVL